MDSTILRLSGLFAATAPMSGACGRHMRGRDSSPPPSATPDTMSAATTPSARNTAAGMPVGKIKFTKMNGLGNDFMVVPWPSGPRSRRRPRSCGAGATGGAASASISCSCVDSEHAGRRRRELPDLQCRRRRGRAVRQRRALPRALLGAALGQRAQAREPGRHASRRSVESPAIVSASNLGVPEFRPAALPFTAAERARPLSARSCRGTPSSSARCRWAIRMP